ncbi:MAG: hypothetical protein IT300_02135 [Dehalococcoidia bacterium]|nr:hypothetical protein [Dehalococcoidia bacterium]
MALALTDIEDAAALILRDASNVTWSTAQLDAAIASAIADYSRHRPAETVYTGAETTVDHALDLDSLATITLAADPADTAVVAVEYPVEQRPRTFVRFQRWGNRILLDTDDITAADITLYCQEPHAINTGSYPNVPPGHLQQLATGAAGHALIALAAESSAALTLQPKEAERLRQLADTHLAAWRGWLPRRIVGSGQLFRPADTYPTSKSTVAWPE